MILLDIYIRNNEVLSVSRCLYLVKSERGKGREVVSESITVPQMLKKGLNIFRTLYVFINIIFHF